MIKQWNYITVLLIFFCIVLLAGASWVYFRLIKAIHEKGAEELEFTEKLVAHAVILITYLFVLFGIYLLLNRWVII